MVIDDALRIAGRPGRVVEADRGPFVVGFDVRRVRIALGQKFVIGQGTDPSALAPIKGVLQIDDENILAAGRLQRGLGDGREFRIDDQHLGLGMAENEADRRRIEPRIDGVEHGAGHGHGEMELEHLRHIGRDHRDRIANPDAASHERIGDLFHASEGLGPGDPALTMDDGGAAWIDRGAALDEADGRQRGVVGAACVEIALIDAVGHRRFMSSLFAAPYRCGQAVFP